MQNKNLPPSRKSILHNGEVKPVGPHQRITYSGSVHALQTSSIGASKVRVMTRSRFFTRSVASVIKLSFNLFSACRFNAGPPVSALVDLSPPTKIADKTSTASTPSDGEFIFFIA